MYTREAWRNVLPSSRRRQVRTEVEARWRYDRSPGSFDLAWRAARDALIETFADHDSESVQHTLFAMASAVLERCEEVRDVHLRLPNQHHLLVDLSAFGQENRNEVFVATAEPFEIIEATVTR